jgi:hypothetical protein
MVIGYNRSVMFIAFHEQNVKSNLNTHLSTGVWNDVWSKGEII